MMRTFLMIPMFVAIICCATNVLAGAKVCDRRDDQEAESSAATAKSWDQMYGLFKRYVHCDDGAVAEGFSESVTLLFAEHWGEVEELEKIVRADSSFRDFVIRHIDETVPEERLVRIAENANKRCPKHLDKLCHDISGMVSQK